MGTEGEEENRLPVFRDRTQVNKMTEVALQREPWEEKTQGSCPPNSDEKKNFEMKENWGGEGRKEFSNPFNLCRGTLRRRK